jgi:hypothetical protein
VLLEELDADPAACQGLHDLTQVIEVACEPVHAMHDHRVAGAHERQERFQLRALRVFARRFVAERSVQIDVFQLPLGVLVEAADPNVADPLTDHALPCQECQERIYDLDADVSIKSENDPILTLSRVAPYIRIGYTPI